MYLTKFGGDGLFYLINLIKMRKYSMKPIDNLIGESINNLSKLIINEKSENMTDQESAIVQRYSHDKSETHQIEMNVLIEAEELNLFKILRPKIYKDGNQWCVLLGEDLQSGVCGFGDSPKKAIRDFGKAFHESI